MTETNLNAPILPGIENRTIVVNDNLPALRALPDACVDLIYLDPPFNSGRAYLNPIGLAEQEERGLLEDIRLPAPQESRDPYAAVQDRLVGFVDVFTMEPGDPNWKVEWVAEIGQVIPALPPILEGAGRAHSPSMQGYLTFMAVRLVEMQRILKPTGSIYLHCDPTASHYLKSIMDSVFGAANFRNEIVWHYAKWSNVIGYFQRNHDVILYYSKNSKPVFHRQFSVSADKQRKLEIGYQVNRPGGIKQLIVYDKEKAAAKIEAGDYDRVVYRDDDDAGAPLHDTWHDINIINSQARERTGYPTQKPLALLNRIVEASSNPGDIVLDPFCGCATACVAAEQLGRRWIGMDMGVEAYRQVVKRLRGTFPEMEVEGATAGLPDGKKVHRVAELPGQTDEPIRPISEEEAAAERRRRPRTLAERRDLYGRQEAYCLGCGVRTDFRQMHVDHVVPWIKSGPDIMANLQLLCGHCNETKKDRTMQELWKVTRARGWLVNQRQVELLYRERDAERMAEEAMMKPDIRELWQLPER